MNKKKISKKFLKNSRPFIRGARREKAFRREKHKWDFDYQYLHNFTLNISIL